jgi:type IV secretory pathway VirB3-like protein
VEIPTFKSLYKPMTWGGIPRTAFLLIIMFGMLSVVAFKSLRAILPIAAVYLLMLTLVRIDYKILEILKENLGHKDSYFPD